VTAAYPGTAPPQDLERALEAAEAAYSQHRRMCMRSPSYCWRCRDLRAARSAARAAQLLVVHAAQAKWTP
jgi:hypothetical protein